VSRKRSVIVPWAALALVAAVTLAARSGASEPTLPTLGDSIACSSSGTRVPESGLTCGDLVHCAEANLWRDSAKPEVTEVAVYRTKPIPPRSGTPGPDGFLGVSTVGVGWIVVFDLAGGGTKQSYIYRPEGCR
jgi:hypothetical protein